MAKRPTIEVVETLQPQTTISSIRTIKGDGGFIEGEGQITFLPAEPNSGIVFEISGFEKNIKVNHDNLETDSPYHTTALKIDDSTVIETVEHVLAAISGLGITNLKVLLRPNTVIPFIDGSAFEFTDILIKSEIVRQKDFFQKRIIVHEPFEIRDGDSFYRIEPDPGFVISATIVYPEPIGLQEVRYWDTPESFCLNIAWARTFAFNDFIDENETKKKLPGFEISKGKITESNMLVYKDGEHITTLRRKDEHVRHKILDIIGDLTFLEAPLQAKINAFRPGHRLNFMLVNEINKRLET